MSVNNVNLLGNITKDVEVVVAKSGMAIAKFTVATNKKFKKDGQYTDKASFHNCIAFGKTGEAIQKFFPKGSTIFIDGEIDYKTYEKDGVKKYFTQILVNSFSFCGGKKQEAKDDNNDIDTRQTDDGLPF